MPLKLPLFHLAHIYKIWVSTQKLNVLLHRKIDNFIRKYLESLLATDSRQISKLIFLIKDRLHFMKRKIVLPLIWEYYQEH